MLSLALRQFRGKNKKAVSLYQEWENAPDSPVLTANYPYQVVVDVLPSFGSDFVLIVSNMKIRRNPDGTFQTSSTATTKSYYNPSGSWVLMNSETGPLNFGSPPGVFISEANNDVYSDTGYSVVYFSKTTP